MNTSGDDGDRPFIKYKKENRPLFHFFFLMVPCRWHFSSLMTYPRVKFAINLKPYSFRKVSIRKCLTGSNRSSAPPYWAARVEMQIPRSHNDNEEIRSRSCAPLFRRVTLNQLETLYRTWLKEKNTNGTIKKTWNVFQKKTFHVFFMILNKWTNNF